MGHLKYDLTYKNLIYTHFSQKHTMKVKFYFFKWWCMSLSKCFISSPFSKVKTRKHTTVLRLEKKNFYREVNCTQKKLGTDLLNYLFWRFMQMYWKSWFMTEFSLKGLRNAVLLYWVLIQKISKSNSINTLENTFQHWGKNFLLHRKTRD